MLIHYSDYSAQSKVRIACTQIFGTPSWGQYNFLPAGVYELDDGRVYTFDLAKSTCPECNPIIENQT